MNGVINYQTPSLPAGCESSSDWPQGCTGRCSDLIQCSFDQVEQGSQIQIQFGADSVGILNMQSEVELIDVFIDPDMSNNSENFTNY